MKKPISRSMFQGICVGALAAGVVMFCVFCVAAFFDYAHPESVASAIVAGLVCLWGIVGLLFTDRVYPTKGEGEGVAIHTLFWVGVSIGIITIGVCVFNIIMAVD